ncbi:formylglycine-generating enzyme family protein [Carboxylicivirga marina]|uniref:SUMF1/EgtB/PvdO family nonheme iron enzyme n=1 Tax=Carboxylicivirga marina TaxID=2800988 RepID=A0ABS1HHM4_9BACT|nr:SUMF1/EgtB/PvdO family nonheme iron enzyme [Carboxylicivirga marina]MBK3517178.1 SUMF1/EgtB/PvdO family nonheme iron enzyme [Carboxylicivirga marina]
MKIRLLLLIGLAFLLASSTPKNKVKEIKPKGMVYIPEGSFVNILPNPNETVEVKAFWVSNEVTNAEYKQFIDYAQKHLYEELCMVNLDHDEAKQYRNIPASSIAMKEYLVCVQYHEILDLLIDLSVQPYDDYFSHKKYAQYPVVGVSHMAAQWYCAWKSEMEVKKHRSKGQPLYYRYRLPSENEWMYLASQIQTDDKAFNSKKILPSDKGGLEVLGVNHVLSNVAEWTCSNAYVNDSQMKIVKGSSWDGNQGIFEGKALKVHKSDNDIGFRVVRPVMIDSH